MKLQVTRLKHIRRFEHVMASANDEHDFNFNVRGENMRKTKKCESISIVVKV